MKVRGQLCGASFLHPLVPGIKPWVQRGVARAFIYSQPSRSLNTEALMEHEERLISPPDRPLLACFSETSGNSFSFLQRCRLLEAGKSDYCLFIPVLVDTRNHYVSFLSRGNGRLCLCMLVNFALTLKSVFT